MSKNERLSNQTNYNVSSVSKAFQLIDLLAPQNGQLSVQSMAKKLDVSPSNVTRLLQTMCDAGYVEKKNSKASPYVLSSKFYLIANAMLNSNECVKKYLPLTYKVAEKFNAVVNLNALYEGKAVMLTTTAFLYNRTIDFMIGTTSPCYSGSAGKAMLSLFNEQILDRMLAAMDFEKLQRNTVNSLAELHEELARIRQSGYAMDREETFLGVVSLSFPILDSNGKPHAFSVIMPANRKKELFAPSTIEYVKEKIDEIG